jgi:hypothetical protein
MSCNSTCTTREELPKAIAVVRRFFVRRRRGNCFVLVLTTLYQVLSVQTEYYGLRMAEKTATTGHSGSSSKADVTAPSGTCTSAA